MSSSLVTTALLSGLFAGLVACGVTRAIERLGGVYGGICATLPTTIVPASVGLAYRLLPSSSSDAPAPARASSLTSSMFVVAGGMLIDAVFLLMWRCVPPRLPAAWSLRARLAGMLATSLLVWLALAAVMVAINVVALRSEGAVVAFGACCTAALLATGVASTCTPIPAPKGTSAVSLPMLAARGAIACAAIAVAVLLSALDDIVAGFATTFPAIFMTSMAGLWLSQGEGVPVGAVGPMVLGSVSVPVYAMMYAAIAPRIGPLAAVAATWPTTVAITSVPCGLYLHYRQKGSSSTVQDAAAAEVHSRVVDADSLAVDTTAVSADAAHVQVDER